VGDERFLALHPSVSCDSDPQYLRLMPFVTGMMIVVVICIPLVLLVRLLWAYRQQSYTNDPKFKQRWGLLYALFLFFFFLLSLGFLSLSNCFSFSSSACLSLSLRYEVYRPGFFFWSALSFSFLLFRAPQSFLASFLVFYLFSCLLLSS
jgi:hypothetical protein